MTVKKNEAMNVLGIDCLTEIGTPSQIRDAIKFFFWFRLSLVRILACLKDGQMKRRTDGRMSNGWMDDRWKDGRTEGLMDRWKMGGRQTADRRQIDGRMDRR